MSVFVLRYVRIADLFTTTAKFQQTHEKQVNGRIIVDPDTFLASNPDAMTRLDPDLSLSRDSSSGFSYNNDDYDSLGDLDLSLPAKEAKDERPKQDTFKIYWNDEKYEMSDEQAVIASPYTQGFDLVQKEWIEVLVDDVQDIAWDDTCFDKLAVDENVKSTLITLVELHEESRMKFRDIVARKGVGRVFLLHGPPGAGKTLTAETISEHVRKPLYYATSGELGTDVTQAESSLQKIFNLAQTWAAVLLIDEADVFLARRTPTDIVRNAFVSVFLRTLEYYQGIMILTTNRRHDFDEAFESRIHISIHYELPDATQRAMIWRNMFLSFQPADSFNSDMIEKLARKYEISGREIKNLFSTALAMVGRRPDQLVKLEDIQRLYTLNRPKGESLSRRGTGL